MPSYGKPGYRVESRTLILPKDYPELSQKEVDEAYEHIRQELRRRMNFEELRLFYGDRLLLRAMTAAYDAKVKPETRSDEVQP